MKKLFAIVLVACLSTCFMTSVHATAPPGDETTASVFIQASDDVLACVTMEQVQVLEVAAVKASAMEVPEMLPPGGNTSFNIEPPDKQVGKYVLQIKTEPSRVNNLHLLRPIRADSYRVAIV